MSSWRCDTAVASLIAVIPAASATAAAQADRGLRRRANWESARSAWILVCPSVSRARALAEAEASELAAVFGALPDPVRLRLLSIVAKRGEVCACDMQEALGRTQPTISHHTRVLAEADLIEGDNRGKWTWWHIIPGRLESVRGALGVIAQMPSADRASR